MMKHIRLDLSSYDITVSEKTYEQIVKLVDEGRICGRCEKGYTGENPCVALNTCLACFLHRHQEKRLTFVGLHAVSNYGTSYQFLDPRGYITLSDTHTERDRLEQNNAATLRYWGFSLPETVAINTEEKRLYGYSSWYLHGEFRKRPVLLIEYKEGYGERLNVGFLANRKG